MSYFFQSNQWGERFIHDVNRDTFSSIASSGYYRQKLDFDPLAPDTLHIFIGSDSGLLIRYLAELTLAPGSAIVVVEDDAVYPYVARECEELLPAIEHKQWFEQCPPVHLCSAKQWERDVLDGSELAWLLAGRVNIIQSACCHSDYLQRYLMLFRGVKLAISERTVELKQRCGRRPFIERQMQNAADNVAPFPVQPAAGRGRVAVVLGGGPSLDEHLEWISDNRQYLFLIAVSRLCRRLQVLNLVPDVVVSIDPLPNMYDVSKWGTQWRDVPLVNSYHLAPELLQQWNGPHFYLGERLPWDGCGGTSTATVSYTGATVSHTAVIVAAHLGFSTILMAGVDFCFSASGSTHAEGTPEAALLTLPSRYDAQVDTYDGRQAGTSLVLYRCIEDMRKIGEMINQHAPVLFNISAGSASIATIPFLDTRSLELLHKAPAIEWRGYAPTLNSLDSLKHELLTAGNAFRAIIRTCTLAVSTIARRGGHDENVAHQSFLHRLDVLDRKLEKSRQYMEAIRFYSAYELAQLQLPSGLSALSQAELQQHKQRYYKLVESSARKYLQMIEETEHLAAVRAVELSIECDVSALISEWQLNRTPGRALGFMSRPPRQLSTGDLARLRQSCSEYIDSLQDENTRHANIINTQNTDIDNCLRSLVFLHSKKSIADLHQLSNAITDTQWPSSAIVSFIEALAADLANQPVEANAHFQSVIEQASARLQDSPPDLAGVYRLIEETLSRMTQIYLSQSDAQSALSTLATLCEFCPQYISSYAELLNLVGDTDSALQLLSLYLENYPEDWRAAQQLAELYQLTGAEEQAAEAFNHAEHLRMENFRLARQAA